MGQQISIETLTAHDEDTHGKYWTSFEPYPLKVGQRKLGYIGILNGNGPRKGDRCLVKALRNCCATHNDWSCDVRKARKAKQYSQVFSKEVEAKDIRATMIFHTPMLAEIDEVSSYMCIAFFLGKPKKKMKEYEIVAIEPYLQGLINYESPRIHYTDNFLTSAYSHFTWYFSNGEHVVCKLRGVSRFEVFRFTVPVIHSLNREFGQRDMGRMGIDNFFANHQCNEICRHWPRPDDPYYRPTLSHKEIDLLTAFPLEYSQTYEFFNPLNNGNALTYEGPGDRSPIRATVHCDGHSGCACRYFRLPCRHRVEPFSSIVYLMNYGYGQERKV